MTRTPKMVVKRPSDTPQRSRKRPRVPKFDEAGPVTPNEEENQARRPAEDEEDEEDVQAEYMEEGGYFVEDIYIPPKLSLTERPTRGERLIIEKISCENFKSYGGIKVMGPFHKSFSAIIGPNGNGKSNIIDAMLFVFGYRAKKIRCKKVSVLIHKSELLSRVNSCAVTVHFLKIVDNGEDEGGNGDDLNVVPNSKITVCRRAYSNNTSAYWLNGKRVQFTEVAEFLKRNGIDIVHNRFLILQGEVEQIAQMPPKATNTHETGFLEFIDEVIGTKRYERPLFRLKERMGELEFQRDEKTQRVQLAQQHKDGLKEPLEKAKVYLHNKNIMTRTHHMLNQVKAHNYRQLLTESSEKLKELETSRNAILSRLDEIKKYNDGRRNEYVDAEKAYQIAEAKCKKNKKAMDDADAKYVKLNREVKTCNEERKKKIKEAEKAEEELEKLQGLPQRHEAEIEKLEKRKIDLDKDIQKEEEATKGDIEKLMKSVDTCVAEKKEVDAEFRKLKSVVDEKKAARDTLQKELDRGKANETAEKEKLEKLQLELQKLHEMVKRKSGVGLDIQPEIISRNEADAQKKRAEAMKLANVEHEKRAIFQRLRSQYADAKDTMDGGQITDRVDKALFAAKSQGMFSGLYGRLKDLANIDEKYNVAATVSTGMLDYWVVDSDSTGAECIQFLKDKRLPAQTFVCVNKMGNLKEWCRQAFRTPAASLRIFDLLKIRQPELAPVFFKAYMNTLVAENIDIASKVAYGGSQRHRVVSCQGDIIETTGSLLGGGARITQGKFNSEMSKRLGNTVSKKELDDLKCKCDSAEGELANVSERRRTLEEEASTIEKETQEMKTKMTNYHSDLEASKKMIPFKAALVAEQEQKVKESTIHPRVLQEKTKKIEKADAELEEAMEPYQESEENVKSISDKLKTLQEDKKKEILKKLDKFKDQRKRVVEELNKLNVELRNCEKNKTKLEAKKTKLTSEKQDLESKILAMNEERQQLQTLATEIKEEEKELVGDRDEKEKTYTELKSKANEFDQEEKKLNKQKVTADNNFQSLSDEVRGIGKQERSLTASLGNFELADIPEVEVDPLKILTEEELEQAIDKDLEGRLNKYQQKLQRVEPNLNVIAEYNNACEMLMQRFSELDAVNTRRDTINTAYLTLEAQRMKEFMEGYAMISAKVKELFRMISMGGDAELDLLDSTDPFSCGIDFSVRPRGKTWKKIINLSGGEKTLSSLALVFSLHHFKPSPFYVMDEIDAALDFQNVSIIANYIKDRTKFTQFIIISLRSNMFELADSLLGVYKVENMSYSIRLGVNSVVNKLKQYFIAENRPYLMGSDDPSAASSSRRPQTATTITSTQSTQPTSSQQQPTQAVVGTASRPSFDVSAIQDPDTSVATERVSAETATPTPSSGTDFNGSRAGRVGSTSTEVINGNGNDAVEQQEAEPMEVCESPDIFPNSFEEEEEEKPQYSSTPLAAPARRMRASAALSGIGEEELSSSDDDEEINQIFDSISSANNSQNSDGK